MTRSKISRISLEGSSAKHKEESTKKEVDKQIQDQTGDEEKSLISYINANYVNGLVRDFSDKSFIACSAPIPKTLCKFWQMIWENKVRLIMMLCSEKEVEYKDDPFSYWNKIDDVGQTTFFHADDQSKLF